MSINPFRFSQMPLSRRTHDTWSKGNYIMARKSKYHVFYLYELDIFYAENGYTFSLSKIEFIDAYRDIGRLKPYPDSIALNELLAD